MICSVIVHCQVYREGYKPLKFHIREYDKLISKMVLRNTLDNDLWTLNTSLGIQQVRHSKNNDTNYLINDFCNVLQDAKGGYDLPQYNIC